MRSRRGVASSGVAGPAQVGARAGAEVAQQVLAPPAQADHPHDDAVAHRVTTFRRCGGTQRCGSRSRAAPARPRGRGRRPQWAVTTQTMSAASQQLVGERRRLQVEALRPRRARAGRGRRRPRPPSRSSSISFSAGDSRTSPTSPLYETPSISTVLPDTGFGGVVQRPRDALGAVVGHVLVDLAGQLDELGREVVLARLPAEVERVDRQAVAAQARARA